MARVVAALARLSALTTALYEQATTPDGNPEGCRRTLARIQAELHALDTLLAAYSVVPGSQESLN